MEIAIIGAGVAGLTMALALARKGFRPTVLEQAPVMAEVGAGIQLSPNATAILIEIGLGASLETFGHEPERINLVSGRTLASITHVPVGPDARWRWRAPYVVIHRADLQSALVKAAEQSGLVRLLLSSRIDAAERADLPSHIEDAAGKRPDIIIAADGVWSAARPLLGPRRSLRPTGQLAWRMMTTADAAKALFKPFDLTAFLAPGAHLVAYPLKHHGLVNLVAITAGGSDDRSWSQAGSDVDFQHGFRHWSPTLLRLLRDAEQLGCWPICEVPDGPWQDESLVLIGDAGHAMPPYAAQGAAMAIEDAFVLANCLARNPNQPDLALSTYERLRKPRIGRVRWRAAFNRFAYHASGPFRLGRDMLLSLRKPESLAADFDWLYGATPQALMQPPSTKR